MFALRRGDLPEPPPPKVAALGCAPGFLIHEFDDLAQLDGWCRAWGVAANDNWHKTQIRGGVVLGLRIVAIPSLKALNGDKTLYDAIKAHEFAHTFGYYHQQGGRGWLISPADEAKLDAYIAQRAA
jgi:hypothetical protein